jgi:hypothetical protein
MVRVTEPTHDRLVRLRHALFSAYQEGPIHLPDEQAEHLSLDFILNRLLDAHFNHKRRAQRSKATKSEKEPALA